jgi:hypothetical protein
MLCLGLDYCMSFIFVTNKHIYKQTNRSYRVCAPQLWNALPKHIRACDDFNVFKSTIKTVLFEEAFM